MNPILVSVVIPTYNPGPYLGPGLASLFAQTLAADQFEIIVVDDGSTDGTPERVEALAATHSNLVVIRSEHSGWAGRPRNLGIERARGEFIQFMDQDDRMAPDALQRLTETARRNGSDIVLGKVASDFRGVALDLYRRDRDSCTIHDAPLISSLTPHKMFRTAFLNEHGLRFPEGRRRLEDQLFVVKAYFAARVISIRADEPLYFYMKRDDDGNAGSDPSWDPAGYYANLREVLDVVVANTDRGPQRDRLMRRFCRAQLVGRLAGGMFLTWTPDFRATVFANIRDVIVDYVDRDVDASLGAIVALRMRLIREDRLADLVTLAERTSELVGLSRVESLRWAGGRLDAAISTEIRHRDGTPFLFGRVGGRTTLDPTLSQDLVGVSIDVTDEMAAVRVSSLVRERTSGVEWQASTKVRPDWVPVDADGRESGRSRLVLHGSCQVDPNDAAGGGPLAPGDWLWQTRLAAFGLKLDRGLGADTDADGMVVMPRPRSIEPNLSAQPTLSPGSGLTILVTAVTAPPAHGSIHRRPGTSRRRMRATLGRLGRRTFARLPPAVQRRSIAAIRLLRRRIR
ncbi:MAG TPA: glycosyltransferase family A protein [Candidatus Limnocylindrales bacterium]|nr:glycosyltransferase family A protein [Candidatus Limnocylindrales bacterium]